MGEESRLNLLPRRRRLSDNDVEWRCIPLQLNISFVAAFRQLTTIHETSKHINHGHALSNFCERMLHCFCIIRLAAHSWREKDPADLHTRQTTSLRLEIPARRH